MRLMLYGKISSPFEMILGTLQFVQLLNKKLTLFDHSCSTILIIHIYIVI